MLNKRSLWQVRYKNFQSLGVALNQLESIQLPSVGFERGSGLGNHGGRALLDASFALLIGFVCRDGDGVERLA